MKRTKKFEPRAMSTKLQRQLASVFKRHRSIHSFTITSTSIVLTGATGVSEQQLRDLLAEVANDYDLSLSKGYDAHANGRVIWATNAHDALVPPDYAELEGKR
jgi:hypothetical protein